MLQVDSRRIAKLTKPDEPDGRVNVYFTDGERAEQDFLTHLPETRAAGPFAEQLGLEMTATGDYRTKPPFGETNIKGVFATGDASTMFKVAPIAIGNAALCASGVVCRLHEEDLGIPALV